MPSELGTTGSDRAPILLVRSYQSELGKKPGGGDRPPTPIVDVDAAFRGSLAAQIATVSDIAQRAPQGIRAAGVPVVVRVRQEALAKSKRPYALLNESGLQIAGGERLGELVARATGSALRTLRQNVFDRSRPQDLWQLSTIEHVGAWRPLAEAVGVDNEPAGMAVVDAMARSSDTLSMELFSWLSPAHIVEGELSFQGLFELIGLQYLATSRSSARSCLYFRPTPDFASASLRDVLGIRALYPTPRYSIAVAAGAGLPATPASGPLPAPNSALPIVGVLDSGIADPLRAYVTQRVEYDLPADQDPNHGTFVSGLVAASRYLNGGDVRFPDDSAMVLDAQVLPSGPMAEYELEARVNDVVEQNSGTIIVWNCSFAAVDPHPAGTYTPFAAFMDELAEAQNVLFIQAAGNYVRPPRRSWPPGVVLIDDGLSSPAEATRSVTVGSVAHLDGSCVPTGAPASYSRRGPGVAGLFKPDISHWSGDFDSTGLVAQTGVASIDPTGTIARNVGTSFAAPIVSAVAANLAQAVVPETLGKGRRPTLIKALLVHSARLGQITVADSHRAYYGHGIPLASQDILTDSVDEFTTLYRVQFTTAGEFVKRDIPVPACLVVDGRLRADVTMTVGHDAIVDANYDAECVRTSVQASLGPQSEGKKGRTNVSGMVPTEDALSGWEHEQIEGGKWSPVRSYRRRWPRGTQHDGPWGLKVSLLERFEPIKRPVEVYVLITFRGLEIGMPVRADGVAALAAAGHATEVVTTSSRIRI